MQNGIIDDMVFVSRHFRRVDIMDAMIQRLEAYSSNLEELVAERTKQLSEEKKKTDALLYQMLPRYVSVCAFVVWFLCFGYIFVQHDDVIKWKHFPRYWPFVRGIHRPSVNSPHKGHWRGALMFSLICVWINGWVNNPVTVDLRRYRAHHDVIVMNSPTKGCLFKILDIYLICQ